MRSCHRTLQGRARSTPDWHKWAERVITVLRDPANAIDDARTAVAGRVDPDLLTELRQRYDKAVEWGSPPTDTATGTTATILDIPLAMRLKAKAEQVWLFGKNVQIPWTNNASEQAIRVP